MSIQNDRHSGVEAWIGLAHVKPRTGNEILGSSSGAFVPVLALARNQEEFVKLVIARLESYEFIVVEIDDVELWETRCEKSDIPNEVRALANSLSTSNPTALHRFQTYPEC